MMISAGLFLLTAVVTLFLCWLHLKISLRRDVNNLISDFNEAWDNSSYTVKTGLSIYGEERCIYVSFPMVSSNSESKHEIKIDENGKIFDDSYTINTQSLIPDVLRQAENKFGDRLKQIAVMKKLEHDDY